MKGGFFLRFLYRETRGLRGRLAFFVLCLTVGVAAVVAVAGITDALEGGIRTNARRLLAADMAVRSRRPIRADVREWFMRNGAVETATVREMAAMLGIAGSEGKIERTRLVELKVIDGRYPFYGEVRTDPVAPLDELLLGDRILVARDVLDSLGLSIGATARLGECDYIISGMILEEPDRLDFSLVIGPRVMISQAAFEKSGLGGTFSRVNHRLLARFGEDLTAATLHDVRDRLKDEVEVMATLEVEVFDEAQPALREALKRVGDFIGLVALISLVLGGVGIAETVRTWLASRLDNIAIVRALGLTPGDVFRLYLSQVGLLSVAGCLLGAAIGSACPLLIARLVPEFVPDSLVSFFQPLAWMRGLAIGVVIAMVFAVPPLFGLRRVPCARVLRHDAEPLPPTWLARISVGTILVAGVAVAARLIVGTWAIAFGFTAALAGMAALLAGTTHLFLFVLRRLPRRRLPLSLKWGVAALVRPSAGLSSVLIALGLGVFVVTTLALVRMRLVSRLETALPDRAPSTFLVDIQPDQWEGVHRILAEYRANELQAVPVAMARLAAIDGESVDEIARKRDAKEGRSRWQLTREQRLTWLEKLAPSNRIVEGELWSMPEVAEISLEKRYADGLGAKIGSKLTFDVQGVEVDLVVSSLRTIEWESFAINFFLVVEPGVLEEAPHFMLAAARFDPDSEGPMQNAVTSLCPNVTVVRVRHIIERVGGVMKKLLLGVEVIGLFTFFSGLAILAGAVAAQSTRRRAELSLMSTLGATRAQIRGFLVVEFGMVGALASAIGVAGAYIGAAIFIDRVLELSPDLPILVAPAAITLGALATIGASLGVRRFFPAGEQGV